MALITDDQRRRIAAGAASLDERLQWLTDARDRDNIPSEEAASLSLWNRAYSPGNTEAFTRRLAWDGLDRDCVHEALSRDPSRLFDEPPSWTQWLCRFVEESNEFEEQWARLPSFSETSYFDSQEYPPFLELSVPILRAAASGLTQAHANALKEVSPAARQGLERQLLGEITFLWELALNEQFGNFRSATGSSETEPSDHNVLYQTFVSHMLSGGLVSMFETYPLIAKLLARLVETWNEASVEFLERLERDRCAIATTFHSGQELGKLTSVETGLSDRHGGGRRVVALGFESGLRLVYKPRDVGLELAYNQLLSWATERGLEPRPKILQVLAQNGYGWVEYTAPGHFEDRDAVRRYYRKSGGLICLAYVLRGRDLHMENLIASSDGPVLIDTEMLMQPVAARGEMGIDPGPTDQSRDVEFSSCLETGLLSLIETDPAGRVYDIGGLRGRGGFLSPVKKRVWRSCGTDAIHFVEEEDYAPSQKNQVFLDGSIQAPDVYVDDIIDGFRETYRFLLAHREEVLSPDGPLRWFQGKRTRVVFRASRQYAVLQHLLASPKHQRDGLKRSFVMEALNRVFNCEVERPVLWPLVADERRALENLDIPRFTMDTDETNLTSDSGEHMEGYFNRSGLSSVRALTHALSESHLDEQIDNLREALASSVGSRFQSDLMLPGTTEEERSDLATTFQEYAVWVGRELLAHTFRGGRHWTAPAHLRRRKGQAPLVSINLYDGSTGVGLFMAALAVVTDDAMWRHAATSTAEPLKQFLDRPDAHEILQAAPLGACDGIGSIVYGLSWMSRLMEDPSLVELAIRFSRHISEWKIASDPHLDVTGGAAGAILGLLALHQQVQDTGILDLAVRCGDHLIVNQIATPGGGGAWPVQGKHFLAGFAHGAAGIAYALTRLFQLTGKRDLLDAAERGYRYERSLFSPAKGNWPIVIQRVGEGVPERRKFMTAWCHGAPGIGLARALTLDVVCDDAVLGEIDAAIRTTAHLERSRSDHLCCGNLGRNDVLLTVGLRMGRPELVDSAKAVGIQVASRAREKGHFRLPSTPFAYCVFTPGFFKGLSGIGYQLLRNAVPARLPSVLSFEADLMSAA